MFETIVAIVTPFTHDNLIDFEALIRIIDNLIENGVDGIVVLGSTGECSSISDDERNLIYQFVTKYVNCRIKVILGVGSNSYEKTIKYIKMAENTNCDSLLIVTPYYVCPNQAGLIAYFNKILSNTGKDCILYNVKKRCGCELEPETVESLIVNHDNVIGLKQACGRYNDYINICNKFTNFKLYSGDDNLLLEAMNLNMHGIISVIGNAYPGELVELQYNGDKEWLDKICKAIYKYPSPTGIKGAMEVKELCSRNVRLPLVSLNDNEISEIQSICH